MSKDMIFFIKALTAIIGCLIIFGNIITILAIEYSKGTFNGL